MLPQGLEGGGQRFGKERAAHWPVLRFFSNSDCLGGGLIAREYNIILDTANSALDSLFERII